MAKKSNFQIRAEYYAFRGIIGGLGSLPRPIAGSICRVASGIAYRLLGGPRRTGMRNLEIAFPDMPDAERKQILRGTFESLGRVVTELSQLHKATAENIAKLVDFRLEETSLDLIARTEAEGRGILIITGHFGNWELLSASIALLYKPHAFLARPLDNPLIEQMTIAMRARYGNRQIGKTHSAMTAIKILGEGGILGILADVNSHPKEGVFVPFFGLDACTSNGPALMAIRSNAYLYPTFCVWEKALGRYKIVHGKLIEPSRTGDRKEDIRRTTAEYTAEIERFIRMYPDQWMWLHKRWKTRPPGEAKIYD